MILEKASLYVSEELQSNFEKDFRLASKIISSMPGYIKHSLGKCIEKGNKYILLVEWESLKDHEEGFRKSDQYKDWKKLLHHYYSPFPEVEHYNNVTL